MDTSVFLFYIQKKTYLPLKKKRKLQKLLRSKKFKLRSKELCTVNCVKILSERIPHFVNFLPFKASPNIQILQIANDTIPVKYLCPIFMDVISSSLLIVGK